MSCIQRQQPQPQQYTFIRHLAANGWIRGVKIQNNANVETTFKHT